jgi:glycine cleavage system H lipoate-binding protein
MRSLCQCRISKRCFSMYFTKHDEYMRYDKEANIVTFGISDFAQNQLGNTLF